LYWKVALQLVNKHVLKDRLIPGKNKAHYYLEFKWDNPL